MTEALEARQLGWEKTIGLVEGAFTADEWQQATDHEISCVIHHGPQLEWALQNIPPAGSATRVAWLKYNTGMNRLGFNAEGVLSAAKRLHEAGYQLILATHFANADDHDHPLNAMQIERFSSVLATLKETISQISKAHYATLLVSSTFQNIIMIGYVQALSCTVAHLSSIKVHKN